LRLIFLPDDEEENPVEIKLPFHENIRGKENYK